MVEVTVIPRAVTYTTTNPANVSGTASKGTASNVQRSDHVHTIGSTVVTNAMLAGSIAYSKLVGTDIEIGSTVFVPHSDYNQVGSGTWTVLDTGTEKTIINTMFRLTAVDGAWIDFKVYLPKGTYTLKMNLVKGNNYGILDIQIDASEVASFDCYNASAVYETIFSQASISVATSGIKTIKLLVDGKNASSSNYSIDFMYFSFIKTA